MNVPGPDGVVCGNGCDALGLINPDCPQHGKIMSSTAPIVACDNAITHYDKVLERLAEDERRLVERLRENRQHQTTLRAARSQWHNARDVLIAAQLGGSTR